MIIGRLGSGLGHRLIECVLHLLRRQPRRPGRLRRWVSARSDHAARYLRSATKVLERFELLGDRARVVSSICARIVVSFCLRRAAGRFSI